MKKGILAVMALTTTLLMTSCGSKGVSEETKTAMTTFETSWKATEDQMMAFGTTMNTTMADMNKMMDGSMAMDMSKMKGEEKEKCDMMMAQCTTIKTGMAGMKTDYAAAMEQWKADTQAYANWKKKGHDDNMTDEAAMAGMAEWNAKLAMYNTKLTDMNAQLTSMQGMCKTTCDSMMHMDMPM